MKHLLLSLLMVSFLGTVFAANVELDDLKKVAQNSYYQKLNMHKGYVSMNDVIIYDHFIIERNGVPAIYAFNFKGYGFILISAEDAIEPILGYGFDNHYNPQLNPDNFNGLMQEYVEHIEYLRSNSISASDEISLQWNDLLKFDPVGYVPGKGTKDVEPLLTCTWNQDWPYNYYCPEDDNGPGDHVYVGCVATAMAQIMMYWRYPLQGSGSHSYYQYPYGTISADFGNTTYDWNGMLDNSDSYVNEPMALIGFHAAVSVEMGFGPDGSGAYSTDVPYAMINYFNYSNSTQYKQRQGVSLSTWENWAQSELNDLCPVYYSGRNTDNAGHAFVLDGYHSADGLYHFNFGWSGYDNGWYLITNAGGFSIQQGMVINIMPDDPAYPYGCTPDYERTSVVGSFEDGSGPQENYETNTSCSWLINPQTEADSISSIKLEFVVLDTETGDIVTIYDGATTDADVLGTYSGTSLPSGFITSTGNQMLVTFEANGNATTATGWRVEYNSVLPTYCTGLSQLTAPVGDFEDGSGTFNYHNNTNCMWKIEPAYANGLTLSFTMFDTEEGLDIVKVYDASNNQLIGEYSGTELPDDIYVESGKLFITFQSSGAVSGNGFSADWEVGNVGVDENYGFNNLSVFPNPASETLTITFDTDNSEVISLRLISVTGELVYTEQATGITGTYAKSIDLSEMAKGIYFLNITSGEGTMNKKIVVK